MGSGSSAAASVARMKVGRRHKTEDIMVLSEAAMVRRNREINRAIEGERRKMRKVVKLLLVGAGESGKSTFAKQLRLIHHSAFSESERVAYKMVIISNLISGVRAILDAMSSLDIHYSDPMRKKDESFFRFRADVVEQGMFDVTRPLANAVTSLWRDPGVQQCYDRSNEYHMLDSAPYFIESIHRIAEEDWIPTEEDIVRSRLQTTGVIETRIEFRGLNFRIVDVGGQRSERKKWIHCFEDVTAILFTVAISEYDQVLREDQETSRMQESLMLFDSICNAKWFSKTAMILFLNKCDLFETKIERVPLTRFFKAYTGPNKAKPARTYISMVFKGLSRVRQREIYHHFTTAIDKSNVQFVFDAVADVIMKKSLATVGMF